MFSIYRMSFLASKNVQMVEITPRQIPTSQWKNPLLSKISHCLPPLLGDSSYFLILFRKNSSKTNFTYWKCWSWWDKNTQSKFNNLSFNESGNTIFELLLSLLVVLLDSNDKLSSSSHIAFNIRERSDKTCSELWGLLWLKIKAKQLTWFSTTPSCFNANVRFLYPLKISGFLKFSDFFSLFFLIVTQKHSNQSFKVTAWKCPNAKFSW